MLRIYHIMRNRIFLLLLAILMAGCSTVREAKTKPEPATARSDKSISPIKEKFRNSEVKIDYVLGRDHYHLSLASKKERTNGLMTLDKQVLEQGAIDPERYFNYFEKIIVFIDDYSKTNPGFATPCKNPFKIIARNEEATKVTEGCRSPDQTRLSRLIKEGEFLLYSKN
jgi:hypothetical protein